MDIQTQNTPWEDLLDELFALSYEEQSRITAVEQKIYVELGRHPQNLEGLITLMFAQIMLGNASKARSMAHKIWEIGGSLSPFFEQLYIVNLLNLGLLDMASILLKPRFEQLRENIDFFYPAMIKFAVMTGSLSLINRIAAFPDAGSDDEILFDFAEFYDNLSLADQFKNIAKLIMEHAADYLCTCEYELYDDRGFPELRIVLYVNYDRQFCAKMQQNITSKIEAFWRSGGHQPLNNLSVSVENIRAHPAWDDTIDETVSQPADDSPDNWGW